MSTVTVATSGDAPAALPVEATDAIAAAASYLAQCLSVLTQTEQTGLSVQEYAAVASAAAAAAQAAAATAYSRVVVNDVDRTGTGTDIYVEWSAITAPRVYTLPPAAQAAPGRSVTIADASGSCSSSNTITAATSGGDTFVGGVTPQLASSGASMTLYPTASNAWIIR